MDDAECLYPEKAKQDPFAMRLKIASTLRQVIGPYGTETPMVVRFSHMYTVCQANCMAFHTPGVNDVLTSEPMGLTAPVYGQNPWSILMCAVQCATYTLFNDDMVEMYVDIMKDSLGFALQMPSDRMDIRDASYLCFEGGKCAQAIAITKDEDYDPYVIGHIIGNQVLSFFEDDGWNADGKLQYDRETDSVVSCTGSCRPYQDTTGYKPVPDPRFYDAISTDDDKHNCTGLCRRWQPLQEGDTVGSLVQQEFVVPHIGKRAKTYLRTPTLTLSDPGYDLYGDSLQVIEEVKITSGDQTRKSAVKIFDNKQGVRAMIQTTVEKQHIKSRDMSFQEYLLYLIGISTAEYDGLVQAWHEKVEHDIVRPTTVIKHWDDDILNTYGGDPSTEGPVDIYARDFEAFIRVMPHGEFPSGSSCLCSIYAEFTDLYLVAKYNRTITDIKQYADMTELSDVCGVSRVWGGLHYPPSIGAGVEVCSGLGTLASIWTLDLEGSSTFSNAYYKGDGGPDRSQCTS